MAAAGTQPATSGPITTNTQLHDSQTQANADYQTFMTNYQTQQRALGYSDAQIAAMASPWSSANQSNNQFMTNYDQAYKYFHPAALGDQLGSSPELTNATKYAQNSSAVAPSTQTINGITYAGYNPGWNSSMALAGKYQDQVDQNSEAFKKQRAESMSAAPTGWAEAERLRQNQLSMQQRDAGAQQVAGQTAQAEDSLAAQGGLSSGARERVAEGGAKNYIGMEQGINTNAINNDLSIGSTDEQNKLSMMGSVAAEEANRSKNWMSANQYDQNQYTEEQKRLNDYNSDLASKKNAAYAAEQQARADANSGGGSFICSALKEAGLTSKQENKRILAFGVTSCLFYPKFGVWYFRNAPKAIAKLKSKNFNFASQKQRFIDDIFETIEKDGRAKAQRQYMIEARNLICVTMAGDQAPLPDGLVDFSLVNMVYLPLFLAQENVLKILSSWLVKRAIRGAKSSFLLLFQHNHLSECER